MLSPSKDLVVGNGTVVARPGRCRFRAGWKARRVARGIIASRRNRPIAGMSRGAFTKVGSDRVRIDSLIDRELAELL
jgi:hypothetical protein